MRIVSRETTSGVAPFHRAVYAELNGARILGSSQVSDDNGRTWAPWIQKPDFAVELPHGYRRSPVTSAVDPRTGRLLTVLNALDTPGLDPKLNEPPIAQSNYYLRYRVSDNGGRSWLFDEPIIESGAFVTTHPVDGVWISRNAIFLGDAGSIPLFTTGNKVLVPAQVTVAGEDGKLVNPGGGYTWTELVVLIGTWADSGRLSWTISERIVGDPTSTTRGLIEPTLAEFPDGRILMVMRGSNGGKKDPDCSLPSYKWFSVSRDGGATWSKSQPWTCDDGKPFFSPSSMSILFKHSSGRWFWAGNMCATNCQAGLPRWPLVLGEVNPRSLQLMRDSLLVLDTEQPADKTQGRLDISHVTLLEDRETKEIVASYLRYHHEGKACERATARVALVDVSKR